MRLAAVIVTYNRLAQLQITLPRVLAEAADRVIVVDNASTDGTPDWLTQWIGADSSDSRLTVLRLTENRGGAGGFEAGMAALSTGNGDDPDWIVLMDDDARPLPGALLTFRQLLADTDTESLAAVAAAVILPDGRIAEMNRPSRNPFWHGGLFLRTLMRGGRVGFHVPDTALASDAAAQDIDIASFVGYFVSRTAIARAGLPEGGLFIYGDDVLYSLRLRRAGLRILLMPAIRFEHDCGTMDARFVYRPLWKIYYHCRNGVSIARQAAGPLIFPLALTYYTLLWARRGRHCTPAERPLYRRMMWTGLCDGLLGRRGRNDTMHALAKLADSPPKG